jgi:hypothetical protein
VTPFVAHLRIFIHLCILSPAFAAAIWASPPWDKSPADWTPAEIKRVLTNSPWAQETSATIVDPYDAIEPTPAPLPGAKEAGIAGPSTGPRWDGGVGHNRMGRLPTVPITVRWESATPIREALRLSASTNPAGDSVMAKPAVDGASAYIITVIGLVQGGKYRAQGNPNQPPEISSSDGGDGKKLAPGDPEDILEAFMQYSRLRAPGIADIHPENVKLDPATGAVHIFFPRAHPLERHQKEVQFITHLGSLNVSTKFRLGSMTRHGQLEL